MTIINKEHGAHARDASVIILPKGLAPANAAAMYLTAAQGNVGATSGITLGGMSITNNAPWRGQWTALSPVKNSQYKVTVPAASAAAIKNFSY